ncbi:hypothetical protein [Streptomyces aurantiacus]|uniref:hypothetical protein n=1 Tax=Streptomyces aurantiacus TaxID=47760 RepID=UPI0033DBBE60
MSTPRRTSVTNGDERPAPARPATEQPTATGHTARRPGPGTPPRPFAPPRPSAFEPFARRAGAPQEAPSETTRRLRPIPADPPADPHPAPVPVTSPSTPPSASSSGRPMSGPGEPFAGEPFSGESFSGPSRPTRHIDRPPDPPRRPFVSLALPDTYDGDTVQPRQAGPRRRSSIVAAAACVVLGLGLIGGAVTGSWLTGDSSGGSATPDAFTAAGDLWHSVPVDELFPATVKGEGAGPGGADRTWTRIAVAPASGCEDAFDPLLRKALAPAGCLRLLRATYTDATHSHVITVGLLFTKADSAAMAALHRRFEEQGLDSRRDLMPLPYAAKGTLAAGFGDGQRASWTLSVLTDAPVVVYAVSGFADGRDIGEPEPAADAMKADATTPVAQAGLGHAAQGLADRVERSLRKTVDPATEKPS